MNRILTISVIAMFAVVLGVSAFAPAMAAPGNPNSKATTQVCHFFEAEFDDDGFETSPAHWGVLHTNSNGATNGHVNGHGDKLIDDSDDPVEGTISTVACGMQDDPVTDA